MWNRNPNASKALEGFTVLTSPAAVFVDVVVTMLSDDAAMRNVIMESSVLDSARKDCVHDLGTQGRNLALDAAKAKHAILPDVEIVMSVYP